jgi:hypothetical protein
MYCHQFGSGHPKADSVTVLECMDYSFFILCRDLVVFFWVINNEGERRWMCQHIGYRRAIWINEIKTKVGCQSKCDVSPSSAYLREPIPPTFADPFSYR